MSLPVVGQLAWADGRPVSDAEVAVSIGWTDRSCEAASVRTRTDRAGHFELPGIQRGYGVTVIIPGFDRAAPIFRLCAEAGGSLYSAYEHRGRLSDTTPPDTVTCIVWELEGQPRVSCAGQAERAVVTGGHWVDEAGDGREGVYRLLRTQEPTPVSGDRGGVPQEQPHVYVQWVEIGSASALEAAGPYRVRTTLMLPLDHSRSGRFGAWSFGNARAAGWRLSTGPG